MKEAAVEAAFVHYLLERGWDVDTDKVDHTDVVARRGAEHLVAEVKGTTAAPGLDIDTAYGQLLRRMGDRPEGTRFAMVVPESARQGGTGSAGRGSLEVRDRCLGRGRTRLGRVGPGLTSQHLSARRY